ncbi:MAG: hypothetical protein ACRD1V_11345 [Vicinamibacterales bacterium]
MSTHTVSRIRKASVGTAAVVWGLSMMAVGSARPAHAASERQPVLAYENVAGLMGTFSVNGAIDLRNPFFQSLGTNGRTCLTCHAPDSAWTITPQHAQLRFLETRGTDPLFTNNDGSVCEGAIARTVDEKRQAYRLLLTRGLIRIGMDVHANAQFVIDSVRDPNRCGPASNDASLYRRPLPAANLRFLSAVMWDGRESTATSTIDQDLLHQANDATTGHAQAARDLTPGEARQIVDFEEGLFAAQMRDWIAGDLNANGASGGPLTLSAQPFFIGMNDPVGLNPTGAPFNSNVFTLFDPWLARGERGAAADLRQAIARGEQIFNTKPITLSGVGGLNNFTFASGVTVPDPFVGTCSTCHDTLSAGSHSVKAALNIGVADPSIAPYLPVYTLRNIATGETVTTTDPGRAMITGQWADIGKFKGPVLRALAARPPYFHNGSATTLGDVVDFYNTRFHIGFTPLERAELIAFLNSL